jgi:hypothetical protein
MINVVELFIKPDGFVGVYVITVDVDGVTLVLVIVVVADVITDEEHDVEVNVVDTHVTVVIYDIYVVHVVVLVVSLVEVEQDVTNVSVVEVLEIVVLIVVELLVIDVLLVVEHDVDAEVVAVVVPEFHVITTVCGEPATLKVTILLTSSHE